MIKRSMAILVLLGVVSASEAQISQSVQKPSIDIGVATLRVIDISDSWNDDITALDRYNNQMSTYEPNLQLRQTLFVPATVNMELSSYPLNLNSHSQLYHQYQSEDSGDIWDDHAKEIAIVAIALLVVVLIFD